MALIRSVFFDGHFASDELVQAFRRKFEDRRWKMGVLRTLRGHVGHTVAPLLDKVEAPTLCIWAPTIGSSPTCRARSARRRGSPGSDRS